MTYVYNVPVRNTVASSTACAKMDRPTGMLCLSKGMEFSKNSVVKEYLTLRNLCESYRNSGGKGWVGNASVPELDGAVEEGQMCRMRGFRNIVGCPADGAMIAYPYTEHSAPSSLLSSVKGLLASAVSTGMLWCPPMMVEYERMDDQWMCGDTLLSDDASQLLSDIEDAIEPPQSVYSCHAFYEAQRIPDTSMLRSVFTYDSQVTPVTGLYGTYHNNTAVDVEVDEDPEMPSIEAREYRSEFKGLICAGHTAHSQDAGIARRVTNGVHVGLLNADSAFQVTTMLSLLEDSEGGDWRLFCMGHLCRITEPEARGLWAAHTYAAKDTIPSSSMYCIWWKRILVVTISSGVLRKKLDDGVWRDTTEMHGRAFPPWDTRGKVDETGALQLEHCFSPYFSLIPYVRSDRPPRPLMASVQTQQAVCAPWSPGTAAVAPCYVSRPLVRTPLVDKVLKASGDGADSIADEVPGLCACFCFVNAPENYEDSMIVSRRFVDMGGFSSTAICAYLLPAGEYVPPPGFPLCSKVCRWWKSSCPRHCRHKKPQSGDHPARVCSTSREPTGTVISSHITPSGEVSVRVLSFAQLQTGDKLSTGHGQKGVANIVEYEDMPFGVTDNGEVIHFDIMMAISSVVNRQTNGQVYEAVSGLNAIRSGSHVIAGDEKPCIDEEVTLFDGTTGEQGVTLLDDGSWIVSRATWGFTRVYSQTQMVRERHHATHFVPGKASITATKGRSRGGPIQLGEMEIKGMVSIGLVSCAKELISRGNMITCAVCARCRRLSILCQCEGESEDVHVSMPYGTMVFDVTSAATEGKSLEYDIAPAE